MKPVNKISSVLFKNGQLHLEGHWTSIRIDSLGHVDITNMTEKEFGGNEDVVVTMSVETLKQLMDDFEDKIAGRCEGCHHYVLNAEEHETTRDGCILCRSCYGEPID
ncbi:hypothetical protein KAR91_63825 [Candidatus Pacearchaeota archaeon]|nr:hypothetical protein [Candidatus Pacearchaeota archaeon]